MAQPECMCVFSESAGLIPGHVCASARIVATEKLCVHGDGVRDRPANTVHPGAAVSRAAVLNPEPGRTLIKQRGVNSEWVQKGK